VKSQWPKPNAENCSLAELETAMRAAASPRSRDRMRAIRALILGEAWEGLVRIFEIDDRTLRRWVRRFNGSGIDGLVDRPRAGRPRKIQGAHVEQCLDLIEHPDKAGQTHWTGKKFHGHLRQTLQLEVGYSTVLHWLHENNFRLKVPQPWPDRQDEALRQSFVEQIAKWISDEDIDLWYGDETGIEGDPRPRRRWAKIGEKTRVTHNGDHIRMNVVGAVCPRTGEFFSLEMSHSDRECFQAFLDTANQEIPFSRRRNFLIVDNASWHKCKSLSWGSFEPIYLPPYSPDLNPIERLWLLIKAQWFTDFIAKTKEALIQRLDQALLWAIDRKDLNRTTCSIRTKL